MAREKSTMELKDILIRLKQGHRIKQIQRDTGTHREVTRKLRKLAAMRGWLGVDAELPEEKELREAYYGKKGERESHPLDQFRELLVGYVEDDLTYVAMHALMKDRVHCSLSTLRRYVRECVEPDTPKESVRRGREMSVMEVDFGRLGVVYDPRAGRNRVAYVFSGRLRYSARAYRDIVFDQRQETFWECHVRAFEYFGGVPERVTPDNLKAAIVEASFHDPVVNRGYRELAEHYGFLIDPCLPYHPEHKGGVEGDIKYVKGNFYAIFRTRQKEMGRDVPLADDLLPALRAWERETADVRVLKREGMTPNALFERERIFLKGLPPTRFDLVTWKSCTVGRDSRVCHDLSLYSVPGKFIGKKVMVAANTRVIRVFYAHELVCEHQRSLVLHQDVVNPDHLSRRALAYMEYTGEKLLEKARSMGQDAEKLVRFLLEDRTVSRNRFAWGIVGLSGKYGNARVNAACRRAMLFDAPRYDTVKRILEKNLDSLDEKKPVDSRGNRVFTFARGTGYFDKKSNTEEQS